MGKNLLKDNSAISTVLAVALVIIVLVAGIIAAYYFTNLNTSSTPSQAEEQSGPLTEPVANFQNGAYINYAVKYYDEAGQVIMQNTTLKETIAEGSYNGTECWKLIDVITTTIENGATASINTLYVSKDSLEAIHLSVKNYTNNDVTYENELDINFTQNLIGILITKAIDPQNVTNYETAGTFTNCAKATITVAEETTYVWVHPDVPAWGIVKMETYNQGKLIMRMELDSYFATS